MEHEADDDRTAGINADADQHGHTDGQGFPGGDNDQRLAVRHWQVKYLARLDVNGQKQEMKQANESIARYAKRPDRTKMGCW